MMFMLSVSLDDGHGAKSKHFLMVPYAISTHEQTEHRIYPLKWYQCIRANDYFSEVYLPKPCLSLINMVTGCEHQVLYVALRSLIGSGFPCSSAISKYLNLNQDFQLHIYSRTPYWPPTTRCKKLESHAQTEICLLSLTISKCSGSRVASRIFVIAYVHVEWTLIDTSVRVSRILHGRQQLSYKEVKKTIKYNRPKQGIHWTRNILSFGGRSCMALRRKIASTVTRIDFQKTKQQQGAVPHGCDTLASITIFFSPEGRHYSVLVFRRLLQETLEFATRKFSLNEPEKFGENPLQTAARMLNNVQPNNLNAAEYERTRFAIETSVLTVSLFIIGLRLKALQQPARRIHGLLSLNKRVFKC